MKYNLQKIKIQRSRGFILPLTLLVSLIILTISSGISIILSKELYFSKVSRESQLAYYAADDAMMCTVMIDDKYIDSTTGLGIFPYDGVTDGMTYIQSVVTKINAERQVRGFPVITVNDIKCATVPIFSNPVSNFVVKSYSRKNSLGVTEIGNESSFNMKMDLGGGASRCASVTVYKTSNFRQIIARGFTTCNNGNYSNAIERAIINTTEIR